MDKRWIFVFFVLFFALPMLKFVGPFALFFLPFLFFMMAGSRRGRGHHEWGWHCTPDNDDDSGKRKEKPKRDYIETVDGEYFEIIEEPRRA
ncbi:MAG: hypothetical protein AAF787_06260 [Chloroflexota bacterium]